MPTCEHEDVDHNANKKEGEEEMSIQDAPTAILKMKKPILKAEGKQPIEEKDGEMSTSAASPEEKTSSSGQDVQMTPQQ